MTKAGNNLVNTARLNIIPATRYLSLFRRMTVRTRNVAAKVSGMPVIQVTPMRSGQRNTIANARSALWSSPVASFTR